MTDYSAANFLIFCTHITVCIRSSVVLGKSCVSAFGNGSSAAETEHVAIVVNITYSPCFNFIQIRLHAAGKADGYTDEGKSASQYQMRSMRVRNVIYRCLIGYQLCRAFSLAVTGNMQMELLVEVFSLSCEKVLRRIIINDSTSPIRMSTIHRMMSLHAPGLASVSPCSTGLFLCFSPRSLHVEISVLSENDKVCLNDSNEMQALVKRMAATHFTNGMAMWSFSNPFLWEFHVSCG